MFNETRPNKVRVQINTDNLDKLLSFPDALSYINKQESLQKHNIEHLIPMNNLIELLDISRSTVENNILKNENIRHFEVTGEKLPKNRNYFDSKDLINFLIDYCKLTYYKITEDENGNILLLELKGDEITNEERKRIEELLVNSNWASNKQLCERLSRTRRIISRLSDVVSSITFSFSDSQRHFRRFLVPENDDFYLNLIKNYKKYEEKIIKG
jgi:hypothetical protein